MRSVRVSGVFSARGIGGGVLTVSSGMPAAGGGGIGAAGADAPVGGGVAALFDWAGGAAFCDPPPAVFAGGIPASP